jgi:hypothetical protein
MAALIMSTPESVSKSVLVSEPISTNDRFNSDPTMDNFCAMLDEVLKSTEPSQKNRVLAFCDSIDPSFELFYCVTRALQTSSEVASDYLSPAVTSLLMRYSPTKKEVKEFSDVRPCYCSLKMHLELDMKLQDGTLIKIMNYLSNAITDASKDMSDERLQYRSMLKVLKEHGYVLGFTKPEKKIVERSAVKGTRTEDA